MDEAKQEEQHGARRRLMRGCAVCGRVAAVLSLVVLAKRLRAKRHEEHEHKRFPIFGH